jgi:hypothetical protein
MAKIVISSEEVTRVSPTRPAPAAPQSSSPPGFPPPSFPPPGSPPRNTAKFAVAIGLGAVFAVVIVALVCWLAISGSHANSGTNQAAASDAQVEAERTKQAILHIMSEDQRIGKVTMGQRSRDATPSQVAQAIGNYLNQAGALDTAECPADFRVAYKQHLRAWEDAEAAIQQLPDGFLEGVFMGAMNALLQGETDGGGKRLQGDLKRALDGVRTSWEEVERIGAKYGAAT